eukprot:2286253-Rhodomonas_salina.1
MEGQAKGGSQGITTIRTPTQCLDLAVHVYQHARRNARRNGYSSHYPGTRTCTSIPIFKTPAEFLMFRRPAPTADASIL